MASYNQPPHKHGNVKNKQNKELNSTRKARPLLGSRHQADQRSWHMAQRMRLEAQYWVNDRAFWDWVFGVQFRCFFQYFPVLKKVCSNQKFTRKSKCCFPCYFCVFHACIYIFEWGFFGFRFLSEVFCGFLETFDDVCL